MHPSVQIVIRTRKMSLYIGQKQQRSFQWQTSGIHLHSALHLYVRCSAWTKLHLNAYFLLCLVKYFALSVLLFIKFTDCFPFYAMAGSKNRASSFQELNTGYQKTPEKQWWCVKFKSGMGRVRSSNEASSGKQVASICMRLCNYMFDSQLGLNFI